jgi:hypothetical protein
MQSRGPLCSFKRKKIIPALAMLVGGGRPPGVRSIAEALSMAPRRAISAPVLFRLSLMNGDRSTSWSVAGETDARHTVQNSGAKQELISKTQTPIWPPRPPRKRQRPGPGKWGFSLRFQRENGAWRWQNVASAAQVINPDWLSSCFDAPERPRGSHRRRRDDNNMYGVSRSNPLRFMSGRPVVLAWTRS